MLEQAYYYTSIILCLLFGSGFFILFLWKYKENKLRFLQTVVISSCIFFGLLFYETYWIQSLGSKLDSYQTIFIASLLFLGAVLGFFISAFQKRMTFIDALGTAFIGLLLISCSASWFANILAFQPAVAYYTVVLFFLCLCVVLSYTIGGIIGFLFFGEGKFSKSWVYESILGKRFLMARRGKRVVSLITIISIFAVMAGTCGMIIVMSVMNGFSSDLRSKIMGTNAHMLVLKFGNDLSEYQKLIEKLEHVPDIVGRTPFILNEVMVSSEYNLTGSIVKGVDPHTVGSVTTLPDTMIEGSLEYLLSPSLVKEVYEGDKKPDSKGPYRSPLDAIQKNHVKQDTKEDGPVLPGIVIGQEMANTLRVFLGDVVNVVSPLGDIGPTGPIPKSKAFRIVGLFHTGMFEYDSKFAYIALPQAQSFFGLGESITGIELKLKDFENTAKVAKDIQKAVGGYPYYTKDWMQMNSSIFSALKLEKIAMFMILVTLILMASLLILVTLIIVVIEKGKEIAILKSMGASDVSIMKIFVTYGLSIGTIGTLCGVFVGITLCLLLSVFGVGLDPQVYYISSLPVLMDPVEIMAVVLSALVVSFLATIPPALFAAKLKPVEGLRYES